MERFRTLEGSQKSWHPSRVQTEARWFPVVCAALRPPATIWQPFRLKRSCDRAVCGGRTLTRYPRTALNRVVAEK